MTENGVPPAAYPLRNMSYLGWRGVPLSWSCFGGREVLLSYDLTGVPPPPEKDQGPETAWPYLITFWVIVWIYSHQLLQWGHCGEFGDYHIHWCRWNGLCIHFSSPEHRGWKDMQGMQGVHAAQGVQVCRWARVVWVSARYTVEDL